MCGLDKIRTRFRQSRTKKISLSQLFRHYGCKYLRKCFFKSFLSLRPISVLNLKWFYQANQKLLAFKDLCNLQTRNLQTRFKIAISQEPLVLESWNFGCDVFLLSPTTCENQPILRTPMIPLWCAQGGCYMQWLLKAGANASKFSSNSIKITSLMKSLIHLRGTKISKKSGKIKKEEINWVWQCLMKKI